TDLFIVGNRALATTYGITFFAGNVISQFGDVLSLDLTNPAAVTVSDELFGNATDNFNQNGGEVVDANTLYVASTTSTGGLQNTQIGNGIVRVIDYSNPANLAPIREVTIPGTVQVLEIAVEGNRALVVGSTGGWKSPFLGVADAQLTGRMTLTLLDITDHRNPVILGTTLVTESLNRPIDTADGGAKLSTLALGNGRFAISRGYVDGRPVLLLADINGDDIVVASIDVPSLVNEMSVANNTLYTTSQSGLLIYDVGAIEGTTSTVTVRVPNSNTFGKVNRVSANSFNIPPDQIIPDTGFNRLVWNRPFAYGTTSSTLTWQTEITGLVPGESRDVTTGTDVAFIHAGPPGAFTLPATSVVGRNAVSISPASQTVAPGAPASYTVTLTNPTNRFLSFTLSTSGVPTTWVDLPRNVFVDANSTTTITLRITAPPTTPNGSSDFVVFAAANGAVQGTAQGTLVLDGIPIPPTQPDSAAHGIVASITPTTVLAGQGTGATYVVRLTNTGSETETFAITSVLPVGVTGAFESTEVTIPPGTSNYREITLVLTPAVGTPTGQYPFSVIATSTSSSATNSATGELQVVANGVSVELNASTGNPGDTFQITITNTGTVADTFDLKTAGPAGVTATLSSSQLTLAPNQSQVVTVTTNDVDFVVPGLFNLTVFARSQSIRAIVDSDSVELDIQATKGLASRFDPAAKELSIPGPTSFLLFVDNIGNTEDSYTATISATNGPVIASLIGLNGQPTQTIPIFRLPGLTSGTVLVNAALTNAGQGTVRVQIRSLTDGTIVSESTATLTALAATVSISALSANKAEGDSGTTTFTFDVTRASNVSGATTVDFAVIGSGSDPANSSDFVGTLPSGQVTFAPNETIKTISINVSGDTSVEADEGFTVTLSNPSGGATINVASAVGNIRNDDVNNPPVAVADVALSVEAGGLNNGTAGMNPTGNVLNNDMDIDLTDTKSVVGVAAGSPSSAFANVGTNVNGNYGVININTSGDFAYTLDNENAVVQDLRNSEDSLVDIFTYTIQDAAGLTSTAQVTITITGDNDTATISGTTTGSVAEDDVINHTGGTLTVADPDAGQASFQMPSSLNGIYGDFEFDVSTGGWTYILDNSRPATNALIAGQMVTDSLSVQSLDGSASRSIVITITGADENSAG
ncbi:MAG: VCBS domain-containing protein, partial [Pirellula sp.]